MDDFDEPYTGILERLRPVLERIFAAYGISEAQAQDMLESASRLLLLLRVPVEEAESWLVRTLVERCQMLSGVQRGGRR